MTEVKNDIIKNELPKYLLLNPATTNQKAVVGPYMTSGTSKTKKYLHMTADTEAGFKAGVIVSAFRATHDLVVLLIAPRVGVANLEGLKDIGPLGMAEVKVSLSKYLNLSGDNDERIADAGKPFRVFLKPTFVGITGGVLDAEKVREALESGTVTDAVIDAFQKHTGLLVNTSDADYMAAVTNLLAWNLAPHFEGLFQTKFASDNFTIVADADEFNVLNATPSGKLLVEQKLEAQKKHAELMAKIAAADAPMAPPMEAAEINGDGTSASDFVTLDADGNPIDPDAVNIDGGGAVSEDDASGTEGEQPGPTLN